jgi:hypothetical protein
MFWKASGEGLEASCNVEMALMPGIGVELGHGGEKCKTERILRAASIGLHRGQIL